MNAVNPQAVKPVLPYSVLVGKIIEKLRRERELTQSQMAERLQIGQSAYSRLEAGQSAMTLPQLRKVARVMDMSPHQIMEKTEQAAQRLRAQGVEVPDEKAESPLEKAGILVALGLLLALASSK